MKHIILCCLLLTGCASSVEYVKVPVFVPYPKINIPVAEPLPITTLTDTDINNPGLVALKYNASIKMLTNRVDMLENIIRGINDEAEKHTKPE